MTGKRLAAAVCMACASLAWHSAGWAGSAPLDIQLADGAQVQWRGQSPDESTGAQGTVMYPGGAGAAGFFVAVLTHAALSEGAQSALRRAQLEKANKVLEPYAAALQRLHADYLLQKVMPRLEAMAGTDLSGRQVRFRPTFSLAADSRSLVLDNQVKVYVGEAPVAPQFDNLVRVVGTPVQAEDAQAFWLADDAKPLEEEALDLLAHSLSLALALPAPNTSAPFKTVRYRQGPVERVERAQVVAEGCQRVVMRTLRNWMMSAPSAAAESDAAPCTTSSYLWRAL